MVVRRHIVDRENEVVWFKEPLYVKTTISSDHLKELKEITHKILDNSDTSKNVNDTLAGNIEKELSFGEGLDESKKILEPYARSLADSYLEIVKNFNLYKNLSIFNKQHLDDDLEFVYSFDQPWVNFQKKYEFNPIHHHMGDFSYVLWIQIPFNLKEEMSLSNCVNSNTPSNSLFKFSFTNTSGRLVEYPLMIDKSWEGVMVLFPANMQHQVYPFYTSDDYRISIAGNVKRIVKSKKSVPFDYR
jgi:hypothetical protein